MKELKSIDCCKCNHEPVCPYKASFKKIWERVLEADSGLEFIDEMFSCTVECKYFVSERVFTKDILEQFESGKITANQVRKHFGLLPCDKFIKGGVMWEYPHMSNEHIICFDGVIDKEKLEKIISGDMYNRPKKGW